MQRTLAIARNLSLCLAFGLAATQVHAAGALAIDSNQGRNTASPTTTRTSPRPRTAR